MRLFVGIPLAAPVIEELSAVSMRLQSSEDGLRWSSPQSWHITLQFLGTANQQQYECVVTRLRELRFRAVPVEVRELGVFDRAAVFFAGVKLAPELRSLQHHVTAATRPCGYIAEARSYSPHIALARGKGRAGAERVRKLKSRIHRPPSFTAFVADAFVLYESLRVPTGSRYEVRERFALDGR